MLYFIVHRSPWPVTQKVNFTQHYSAGCTGWTIYLCFNTQSIFCRHASCHKQELAATRRTVGLANNQIKLTDSQNTDGVSLATTLVVLSPPPEGGA